MQSTQFRVREFLKKLGITPYVMGYGFLKDTLCLCLTTHYSGHLEFILQKVANNRRTHPTVVLQHISYALRQGLPNADPDFCEKVLGIRSFDFDNIPASKDFIGVTASYLLNSPL